MKLAALSNVPGYLLRASLGREKGGKSKKRMKAKLEEEKRRERNQHQESLK